MCERRRAAQDGGTRQCHRRGRGRGPASPTLPLGAPGQCLAEPTPPSVWGCVVPASTHRHGAWVHGEVPRDPPRPPEAAAAKSDNQGVWAAVTTGAGSAGTGLSPMSMSSSPAGSREGTGHPQASALPPTSQRGHQDLGGPSHLASGFEVWKLSRPLPRLPVPWCRRESLEVKNRLIVSSPCGSVVSVGL